MQDTEPHSSAPASSALASSASSSLAPAHLSAWLRLERTPGIGPRTAVALLEAFGTPEAIFAADLPALQAHAGPAVARALVRPPPGEFERLLEATLRWHDTPGQSVLALGGPGYPALLAAIPDPPLLLYIKGDARRLAGTALAVVGSRNASVQGRANAEAFAAALSASGVCIVSGLALGIDAAAHEGALSGMRHGAGGTVAVVGTGPDLVYPARHRALAARIAEGGCVVSEYPIGTPPLPSNFPKRNRIISGLAAGVLVVEAAVQSGSLITARQAAEQGRDVFAIPGSIHAALSKGCHILIREGAKLVDTAQDILDALDCSPLAAMVRPGRAGPASNVPDGCAPLLAALGHDPVEPDLLLGALDTTPAVLSGHLLMLELAGLAERLPDGRVQRVVR